MKSRLIIFTRYPQLGKTKTRLIPAIGATKALELHSSMAVATLHLARKLEPDVSLEVHFTGGTPQLMTTWLGGDIIYQLQCEGDLGVKMCHAFHTSFAAGMDRVVIIGIDCPEITTELLQEAFNLLNEADVVLGPAADGGYYLIGLSCALPPLFVGINWGGDKVLADTLGIITSLQLKVCLLPILRDIDRPEDLVLLSTQPSA